MRRTLSIRDALALLSLMVGIAGPSALRAQAPPSGPAKPSAAVSALPAAQTTADANAASNATPSGTPSHRAEVDANGGKLSVVAANASLNEILREVARKTGIKITGGVADERVFGSYGPAPAAAVLAELLEGTGSNMLLVDDAAGHSELILTARNGGPTPPNPNAGQSNGNDEPDSGAGGYVPPIRPYGPPAMAGRGPVGAVPVAAPPDGEQGDPLPPPTPQQIYDQLQRSQQQKPITPQ